MDQPSDKLIKYLVIFVIAIVLMKATGESGFFVSKVHKGKGYSVEIPEGWKKVKKQKDAVFPKGVEIVTFVPSAVDRDRPEQEVFISIYTKKLSTPIWIEDEFPDIIQSLGKTGFDVKDEGEIKIEDVISKWVVYYDAKVPALILEFYMVTKGSVFYKIQYSAHPDKFNVLRSDFEELKDSFAFRFSIY